MRTDEIAKKPTSVKVKNKNLYPSLCLFARPNSKRTAVSSAGMERKCLDMVLVPMGLALMLGYHVWLFYRVMKHPAKTLIGTNAVSRWIWVRAMMEVCASSMIDPSFLCM